MRTRLIAMLSAVLLIGLLVPTGASAKRITAGGSLVIISPSPEILQLIATVVTSNTTNTGLDGILLQQLPLPGPIFAASFVVNEDPTSPGPSDIGTTLILTNTAQTSVPVTVNLYGLDGTLLATVQHTLAFHETKAIRISDLLP